VGTVGRVNVGISSELMSEMETDKDGMIGSDEFQFSEASTYYCFFVFGLYSIIPAL